MKKFLVIFFLMIALPVFSKTADSRNYHISADNMYMIALSGLNNLHYKIVEMQTASGYILFQTQAGNEYLLMVTKTGTTTSNIKIIKVKKGAPLLEVQQAVYGAIEKEAVNIPVEVK